MDSYKKQIADTILQKKLAAKGAVLIEGAKWCGKTTTALQQAKAYSEWIIRSKKAKI